VHMEGPRLNEQLSSILSTLDRLTGRVEDLMRQVSVLEHDRKLAQESRSKARSEFFAVAGVGLLLFVGFVHDYYTLRQDVFANQAGIARDVKR